MPYRSEYVSPDTYHEYKGVTIYNTYNNGEEDDPSSCYFTTSEEWVDGMDYEGEQFDARDLPDYDYQHPPFLSGEGNTPANKQAWEEWRADDQENKQYKAAIEKAIDAGIIKAGEPVKLKSRQEERLTTSGD